MAIAPAKSNPPLKKFFSPLSNLSREKYLKPCARNLIYMLKNLTLSIDYGGTWVRLVLTNKKNKKIRRLKIPSIPLDQIPHLIQSALNQWKVNQCSQLKIGAKGVWKKKNKRMLALKLKKLAKKVIVLSDVEMAYKNTFGTKPGILLIAGTGSIAYGKDIKGRWARAGGLGPKKGDEGSGYWIGKEFLKRKLNLDKSSGKGIQKKSYSSLPNKSFGLNKNEDNKSVRESAALAKNIIERAEKKEPLPYKIVLEAINHLAGLVVNVSKKLDFNHQICVSLQGGLFKNRFFLKLFLKNLRKSLNYL
ncbi:MAG: hypothetical protein A3I11_01015 [Elusimicrobia bacterium RIFCSPLOWO2_02_FULL_39_32]|nr:MAG: hypothetical protein A3B80_08040 [Elusimicrobia bacterium RIFCSPHIGHO2_02_FULL_39_36]OGR92603.1 MAG: hypothetical protein A3I11_01015 [Elusimicrobia bacterium RIFCSPLOWO2_02_FULL_39_32]